MRCVTTTQCLLIRTTTQSVTLSVFEALQTPPPPQHLPLAATPRPNLRAKGRGGGGGVTTLKSFSVQKCVGFLFSES